jgi:replication factor A1
VYARAVRAHYAKVKDLVTPDEFDARVRATVEEWGGLLDQDAAAMIVVERLGVSVAAFQPIKDLEEGAEANLRARVVGVSSVRTFTRQDGTTGRVVNLDLRDDSGFCRMPLWDEDVALVEKGRVAVGKTVRAIDCFVKRTSFGLEVSRGKFGALLVEE